MKLPLVRPSVLKALAAFLFVGVNSGAAELKVAISPGPPMLLSWSTNIPSFAIASKTNVSPDVAWQVYPPKPVIIGSNFVVTNLFSDSSRLFRLSNWPQMTCLNQIKQIEIAFRIWAGDNGDRFPFQVATNQGGTRELRAIGPDGFDTNAYLHFMAISNELAVASVLVCPGDVTRTAALDFANLKPENVTYQLRTDDSVSAEMPGIVLVVCPIDGNTGYCDWTTTQGTNYLK
jgi:hypothetical protein